MVAALEPVASRKSAKSQDDGTLVLPAEARDALEIRTDEDILLFKTEQGILVTTRAKLFMWGLDGIGDIMRESGESLEEWIDAGAKIREELVEEWYPKRTAE